MASNNLVANASKTVFLAMGKGRTVSPPRTIRVGPAKVAESDSEQVLGLMVNKSLSWKDHIMGSKGVHMGIRQRLLLLKRLSYLVPKSSLPTIVEGLIMSKVRYGLSVYGSVRLADHDPLSGDQNSLQVALNDVMRVICGVKLRDQVPIRELLQRTGLLSFNQMAAQAALLLVWKIKNGHCESLAHLVDVVSSNSARISRAQAGGDLVVPIRSTLTKDSFRYQGAKLWNSAPMAVKGSKSKDAAKKTIREFVNNLPI